MQRPGLLTLDALSHVNDSLVEHTDHSKSSLEPAQNSTLIVVVLSHRYSKAVHMADDTDTSSLRANLQVFTGAREQHQQHVSTGQQHLLKQLEVGLQGANLLEEVIDLSLELLPAVMAIRVADTIYDKTRARA